MSGKARAVARGLGRALTWAIELGGAGGHRTLADFDLIVANTRTSGGKVVIEGTAGPQITPPLWHFKRGAGTCVFHQPLSHWLVNNGPLWTNVALVSLFNVCGFCSAGSHVLLHRAPVVGCEWCVDAS